MSFTSRRKVSKSTFTYNIFFHQEKVPGQCWVILWALVFKAPFCRVIAKASAHLELTVC